MPPTEKEETSNQLYNALSKLEDQRINLKKKHDKSIFWQFLFPALAGLVGGFVTLNPVGFFVGIGIVALFSYIIYWMNVSGPFDDIKNNFKAAVLHEFMKTFHSEIDYTYYAGKRQVKEIAKRSDLVSANRFNEEDVIMGSYGNTEFYISEVHLKKKSDKSTRTVLDGLLLKVKVPGMNFPHTCIQSEPGILSKIFGGYKEHSEYGFYYDTYNEKKFLSEVENLFPFIRHLMAKQGDVRISLKRDEIIMFMESDMKLLDDPEPSLHISLKNKTYNENIARQMNTLLFIVESFAKGMSKDDVEERLELESLKIAQKVEMPNQ